MTAAELGRHLDLKAGKRGWRGRCPACDYPGTFAVGTGRGGATLVWCASCQDKAGLFDVLQRITDGTFQPIRRVGEDQSDAEARARKQEAARRCWAGSESPVGKAAETYLRFRGLAHLIHCPEIRFRSDTSHPSDKVRRPAMLALVRDVDGNPVATHRTYLDAATGRKADVEPQKASLGPVWGGAIRLQATVGAEDTLVVGEGLETAASAGLLMDLPAWAAISAGNLAEGLQLPASISRVVIAGDRDAPGARAANAAAHRWTTEGRHVRIAWPDAPALDFNDTLMRARADG